MPKKTRNQKQPKIDEPRLIYNQKYYQMQAMVRDPWFIKRLAELKKRFAEAGCPLPAEPFKKYAEYEAWLDRMWQRHSEILKSSEFLAEKEKITGGSETLTMEQYYAVEDLAARLSPPLLGDFYNEVLEHFGIKKDQEDFREFLSLNIFFGAPYWQRSQIELRWILDRKTGKEQPYLKITGELKKEDILREWDWISEIQKSLDDYVGKNKEWETFDRDIAIYNLYKELKIKYPAQHQNKYWALDTLIWEKFSKKWPKLTVNQIRSIITKTRQRLGEI